MNNSIIHYDNNNKIRIILDSITISNFFMNLIFIYLYNHNKTFNKCINFVFLNIKDITKIYCTKIKKKIYSVYFNIKKNLNILYFFSH